MSQRKEHLVESNDIVRLAETANFFTYPKFYDLIASNPDMRILCEVGVWKGHSIRHLAKALKERGGTFELYAVDLWDRTTDADLAQDHKDTFPLLYEIYCHNLTEAGVRTDVFDIQGVSWEQATFFEDNTLDFCFIDAGHDKESIVKDLNAWYPKVRSGGIFAGHDIHHRPVVEALEELFGGKQLTIDKDQDVWLLYKD